MAKVSHAGRLRNQLSLLDDAVAQGLSYLPDFLTAEEERELSSRIDGLRLEPFEFQQWTGKRKVASFGYQYDYGSARLLPAADIPDWLLPCRARLAAAAGLAAEGFAQVLITRYETGAGIGWHRDRPDFDIVGGVSLLAAATLRLRRRSAGGFERSGQYLEPRSAYLLRGAARSEWYHSIAPMQQPRLSITFRSLRAPQR